MDKVFQPIGNTVKITADSTSTNTALGYALGTRQVRVSVYGSNPVAVAFGTSSVAAVAATSINLLGNTVEVFSVPTDVTHAAVIAAGSTTGSIVSFQCGWGQ